MNFGRLKVGGRVQPDEQSRKSNTGGSWEGNTAEYESTNHRMSSLRRGGAGLQILGLGMGTQRD